MSANHVKAVLAQLSQAERAFFEREPGQSWIFGMAEQLAAMPVEEAAELVRSNIASLTTSRRPRATLPNPPPASTSATLANATNDPPKDQPGDDKGGGAQS